MPTISVDKEDLYKAIGKTYTTEEFDELCFEFGIELDEDTTDECVGDERPQLKIEIPANRYDMLCIEGIAQALNVFLGRAEVPEIKLTKPSKMLELTIHPETAEVRPYAAAAILRNVTLDQRKYESFISLQEKLHSNICRGRQLVAIGTHDFDKMVQDGPYSYKAFKPNDPKMSFVPLNQTKELTGEGVMEFYEKDKNLGKFLYIIKDSPVYPYIVMGDDDTVCSLPPIINSDKTKVSPETKNIFIEVTGTDKTRLEIVLSQIVAAFSEYCAESFTVEPLKVVSEHNGESRITPEMSPRVMQAEVPYIKSCLGLDLSADDIIKLLAKMSLQASKTSNPDVIDVAIPPTRSDILHQCDIMEDAAIGYGFNSLPKTLPMKSATVGKPQLINKVSDIVRREVAMSGWAEVMPLTLCSHDENFAFLNRKDEGQAVHLANPKTQEYQVIRTSLLPGILKTIRENKKHSLPIKVFETGDVVFKDESLERRSYNQRNFGAVYSGKTSGFETVHGLLGRLMKMLRVSWIENPKESTTRGYWIEESHSETFFPGRGATIHLRTKDGADAKVVGEMGILHPNVLAKFEIPYASSSIEFNIEPFQ